MAETCEKNDFGASTQTLLFFWGIPIAAMVLASLLAPPISIVIWAGALFWAGAGCAINAYRCGRLHCYITGPLFLLGGVAVLLTGFGVVSIRGPWVFAILAVGTCVAYKLEFVLATKYLRARS